MSPQLLLLLLSILGGSDAVVQSPPSSPHVPNLPICIVGGGFSGLGTGRLLAQKGYDVEIFEEKGRLGGKGDTFRQGDQILIEKCPLFFTRFSPNIMSYIKEFDLSTTNFTQDVRAGFDPTTGLVLDLPPVTAEDEAVLKEAVARFLKAREAYDDEVFEFGFHDTPPDLLVPMEDWLLARNLSALTPYFIPLITVEGYGDLRDTAALYVLKLVDPEEFAALVTATDPFLTLSEGVDVLVQKLASGLKTFLHHKATHVFRRNENRQEIYFNHGTPSFRVRACRKVILAFPPILQNLDPLIIDLSPAERDVIREVKIMKYTTGGHVIPGLQKNIYFEAFKEGATNQPPVLSRPVGDGEVVGLVKQSTRALESVYSSYSWIRGDFGSPVNSRELQLIGNKLLGFLRKVNPASRTLFLQASQFFPHVTVDSLRKGFYGKFDALQGVRGTYYATTLLTFETMDKALQMAEKFVDKYFS